MSRFCRRNQNRLAREICANSSALLSSATSRHLVRCIDCRRAYDEIVRLHEELAQGFTIPLASEQFTQRIFDKIEARAELPKRRPILGSPLIIGTCTAILLCVLFVWPSRQNPAIAPASLVENFTPQRPNLTLQTKGKPVLTQVVVMHSLLVSQVKSKPKRVTRVVRKKKVHLASHSVSKPYRRYLSVSVSPQAAPRAAFLSPEMRSQRWTQWASYYENLGDYSQAAEAYASAYDAAPTESTAFSAGQSAENAGDVSQAVLYYSQILRQPLKQKPQTEKGTRIWNSERDAA